MIKGFLIGCAVLLVTFALCSCERSPVKRTSVPGEALNFLDVKTRTDIELPAESKLIMTARVERVDLDMWMIQIDGTNQLEFPRRPNPITDEAELRELAKTFVRYGFPSIGTPIGGQFATWNMPEAAGEATVLTTSNRQYLLLKRLDLRSQIDLSQQQSKTNKASP